MKGCYAGGGALKEKSDRRIEALVWGNEMAWYFVIFKEILGD